MAESATILIPDISGYTEFLTKTELVHSSHIINELLDAILAANSGEFVLSEVEGDALLLYRKGEPIEADALVRQCLGMHIPRPDRRVDRGQERYRRGRDHVR